TLDLCAGSGAISVALKKLAGADVTAVELSDKAFAYLKKNSEHNSADIRLIMDDIFECSKDFEDGFFDLIVSNPPYIKSDDIKTLQAEVQKEPAMALDGGKDGFDFYREIIKDWSRKLRKGGALAFELGEGQAEYVAELMKSEGFASIETSLDISGIERAIIGIRY
ncbi:MAG: N5-glutamine methyltransferase family protein, partial [Acutalibacteraceae bacterium]